MPAGLQVYGPDGNLWVDTSTLLGRMYGMEVFGPGDMTRSIPSLAGQGTPFAVIPDPPEQSDNEWGVTIRAPVSSRMSFSGTDLTVRFIFANYKNPYATIYYGAF